MLTSGVGLRGAEAETARLQNRPAALVQALGSQQVLPDKQQAYRPSRDEAGGGDSFEQSWRYE
ncbi:hypothetical protein GT94_14310 [Geobacillus stearothermophilus]|nr:hypothetical protein ET31_02385 [Geobacillus stearothermophilus]KFX32470.1 hypothetical protein GT94_14310 [Geobacillus stearothermophilus]